MTLHLQLILESSAPEHLKVAMDYYNLGTVHNDLGGLEQAKEYHERALSIRLKKLGPDHLKVARCYNSLGTVHHDPG